MNILPPSEILPVKLEKSETPEQRIEELEKALREVSHQLQILLEWQRDIYRFLLYPVFEKIKFKPISSITTGYEGDVYYDSDDDTFKGYDGSTWNDFH